MVRLIASDIDGTLLQGNATTLNKRLFEQIRILKEHNIQFVAASGRQLASICNLFHPVKDEISYIAENGSLCIHQGKVISKSIIEKSLATQIINTISNVPDWNCIVSGEYVCYTTSKNPDFIRMLAKDLKNEVVCVDDFLSEVAEPILKIAVCDIHSPQKTLAYFQDSFADKIKVVTSGRTWFDFIAPNANKGIALTTLSDYLNIPLSNCLAFGDQYNDTEMLEYAGTSYAMSNAAPGISYYATYVTDSVIDVLDDLIASLDL